MGLNHTAAAGWSQGLPARFIALVGSAIAWMTLLMVLITFFVVVCRYAFKLNWIWLQDSIVYLHASVFMLAVAWALQRDEHVRVDIFYRDATPRRKAWVDVFGILVFLIPFCIFLMVTSWDYVSISWAIREGSREASGLPWVYALKTLILVMPALVLLQSLVMLWSCWRLLRSPAHAA
jgi:TRAP-type mannitol/chloroaromatic compound transport system permease small subunit